MGCGVGKARKNEVASLPLVPQEILSPLIGKSEPPDSPSTGSTQADSTVGRKTKDAFDQVAYRLLRGSRNSDSALIGVNVTACLERRPLPSLNRGWRTPDPGSPRLPANATSWRDVGESLRSLSSEVHVPVVTAVDSMDSDEASVPSIMSFNCHPVPPEFLVAPGRTSIVLDWEDVLCPTHWLSNKEWFEHWKRGDGPQKPSFTDRQALCELEHFSSKMVATARAVGRLSCVSSAIWLSDFIEAFLPRLSTVWREVRMEVLLADNKIPDQVLLADNAIPHKVWDGPASARQNKVEQFITKSLSEGSCNNVICVGRMPPRASLSRSQSTNPNQSLRVKTVKVLGTPTSQEICAEMRVLEAWFPLLAAWDGDLDVDLGAEEQDLFRVQQRLVDSLKHGCAQHPSEAQHLDR